MALTSDLLTWTSRATLGGRMGCIAATYAANLSNMERRDAADTTKFQTTYMTWTFGPGIGVLHISSLRIVFVPNMRQILQMNSHVAMERTQNRVLSVVRPWNGVRRPVIVSICAKNKVQSSYRYGATENLKWPMWPHHFDLEMVHKQPYGLYLYQIWRKSLKKARTTART